MYGRLRASMENRFQGRAPRQRPRDAKKEEILTAMDKRRWECAIRDGRIRILGPRYVEFVVTLSNPA